jgi:tRNA pseudouridine55 synthase
MNDPAEFNGFLPIDKPAGLTSARAVDRVKRLLPRGTKIGHAGTLDPFATGLLVLLIGKATKQCEAVMGQRKTYEATIKLGAITATLDPETAEEPFIPKTGTGPARPGVVRVSREELETALSTQVGEILQVPPVFSALKVQGRRAADRVRAGQVVQLAPRVVQVYCATVLSFDWPLAKVVIDCGRGTYIRAIARDLGEVLGVGAYLTQLRRTRVGQFDVSSAAALEGLTSETVVAKLQPLR